MSLKVLGNQGHLSQTGMLTGSDGSTVLLGFMSLRESQFGLP